MEYINKRLEIISPMINLSLPLVKLSLQRYPDALSTPFVDLPTFNDLEVSKQVDHVSDRCYLKTPIHVLFSDEESLVDDNADELTIALASKSHTKLEEEQVNDDSIGSESLNHAFQSFPIPVASPTIFGFSFSSFLANTTSVLFDSLTKMSDGTLPTSLSSNTLASLFRDPNLLLLDPASSSSNFSLKDALHQISSTPSPPSTPPFNVYTLNNTPYLSSTTQLISFSTVIPPPSMSSNLSYGSSLDSLFPLFYLSSMASPTLLSELSHSNSSNISLSSPPTLFPSPILLVFSKDDPLFPSSLIFSLNYLRLIFFFFFFLFY
jgi:hypothetical protein